MDLATTSYVIVIYHYRSGPSLDIDVDGVVYRFKNDIDHEDGIISDISPDFPTYDSVAVNWGTGHITIIGATYATSYDFTSIITIGHTRYLIAIVRYDSQRTIDYPPPQ